jgi:hypothetical protein
MHSCTTENIIEAVMGQGRREGNQMFMERHADGNNRLKEVANRAEVIIAKQWMRPIIVQKWSFNPDLSRSTDL